MIKKTEEEIMKNWRSDKQPLVSICCITFNHESFISTALDSMLMQETDFPFEIIIRDDRSTDKTRDIIKKYAEKFPHIIRTILETENQYSKGVNPFIPTYEKAKGKYVTILEGDDYWQDEHKLQKQADFLEKNNEYVLSYHNTITVNEKNEVISKENDIPLRDYSQEEMLCGETFILTNTVMFQKVKNISSEKLDGVLNADTVLWHLLGYYGKSKYQGEIGYAVYRVHGGGVWSSLDKFKKFENSVKTMHILKNTLPDNYNSLKKRIIDSMNRQVTLRLYKSLKVLNLKEFGDIVRLIVKSEDLSILRVLRSIPSILLQKIKQ